MLSSDTYQQKQKGHIHAVQAIKSKMERTCKLYKAHSLGIKLTTFWLGCDSENYYMTVDQLTDLAYD